MDRVHTGSERFKAGTGRACDCGILSWCRILISGEGSSIAKGANPSKIAYRQSKNALTIFWVISGEITFFTERTPPVLTSPEPPAIL